MSATATAANTSVNTTAVLEPVTSSEPDAGGRRRKRRLFGILAAVLAVLALAYLGYHWLTAGREGTDDAQIATDMVPLAMRVGGLLVEVPLHDHQAIKKGDLVARIDPAEYEARVKQAEADVQAAKAQAAVADAQIGVVEASSRGGLSSARAALSGSAASLAGADAQIEAARAAVLRAEAEAGRADVDLKRARALREQDAIPQAQVDTLAAAAAGAQAAVAQARAQLTAAQESKQTARTRVSEAQGKVEQSTPVEAQLAAVKASAELAHARVAAAEAQLTQAQLNLSYTRLLAPADGHIAKLAAHVGQLVSPSQVITYGLPDTAYVVANFKETQVGNMQPGQTAEVSLDAFPGRKFPARVESIAYGTGAQFALLPPDNASGNFVKVVQRVPVKLVFTAPPSDVRLEAGLSAEVTVRAR
jgi:membrane fusion protein (multidrug efflux system)